MAEKEGGKACMEKSAQLLFTPDLVNFWLTGERGNEITMASTSQMLNQKTRNWDFELLDQLKLPTNFLVNSGSLAIWLVWSQVQQKKECSVKITGLHRWFPHDTASAVAGVPAVDGKDFAYLSSGTWSLMGVENEEPLCDSRSEELGFTNEFGIDGSIRYLKNISGLWIVQECRRHWQSKGEDFDYEQLTHMAREAKSFAAVIDVDDSVFSSIGEMPNKISEKCKNTGQNSPNSKNETVRIALEGLALKYRQVLENLRAQTQKSLNTLHIVGGGTQNELLNQMTADATGCEIIAGPIEATSVGNMLVQMIATGELGSRSEGRNWLPTPLSRKGMNPRETLSSGRRHTLK